MPDLALAQRRIHFDNSAQTAQKSSAWHAWLYRFINTVYFESISVVHSDRMPGSGPVLYLGLHRNGAVDGFVYHQALRKPVFMISSQLRKSWLARLFFDGIVVARPRDEDDCTLNDTALGSCLNLLRLGGKLFVFPEGTSSLGPRHLPFRNGAAWLLLNHLESGGPALCR
jgi:1-acyl-sn-glycerol-3-phosphate acyltransferase